MAAPLKILTSWVWCWWAWCRYSNCATCRSLRAGRTQKPNTRWKRAGRSDSSSCLFAMQSCRPVLPLDRETSKVHKSRVAHQSLWKSAPRAESLLFAEWLTDNYCCSPPIHLSAVWVFGRRTTGRAASVRSPQAAISLHSLSWNSRNLLLRWRSCIRNATERRRSPLHRRSRWTQTLRSCRT